MADQQVTIKGPVVTTNSTPNKTIYSENTDTGIGVFGRGGPNGGEGVYGETSSGASGVHGKNTYTGEDLIPGNGVTGESVWGTGVYGTSSSGNGVHGASTSNNGVFGVSTDSDGVFGESTNSNGVAGISTNGRGVYGFSTNSDGVYAWSSSGSGVYAQSFNGFGVLSNGGNAGVAAFNRNNANAAYLGSQCCAAWFTGDVHITGILSKGQGQFLIDHPEDPANKFLAHSFVESSEMKNVYDGIVVLDANGEAEVEFPSWFAPLNTDFRYQLTPIGAPGPNLYIAEEISGNRFKIAGGAPMMKVSWQVTGVRQDPLAKAHPLQVESEKPAEERGYYLNPELYGATREQSIELVRHPQRALLTQPGSQMDEKS